MKHRRMKVFARMDCTNKYVKLTRTGKFYVTLEHRT
jgi:hypothetical protein